MGQVLRCQKGTESPVHHGLTPLAMDQEIPRQETVEREGEESGKVSLSTKDKTKGSNAQEIGQEMGRRHRSGSSLTNLASTLKQRIRGTEERHARTLRWITDRQKRLNIVVVLAIGLIFWADLNHGLVNAQVRRLGSALLLLLLGHELYILQSKDWDSMEEDDVGLTVSSSAARPRRTSISTEKEQPQKPMRNDSSANLTNQQQTEEKPERKRKQSKGASMLSERKGRASLAENGNGQNGPLSEEQMTQCEECFQLVETERMALEKAIPEEAGFCNLETCRRYLVARSWDTKKAVAQLKATLEWRLKENPGKDPFELSPKALADPLALSMRVVGWANDGRPIAYTCFAEAHDRFDVEANMKHMTLLMEACERLIKQRIGNGLNKDAKQRQWIWVIDFDGFGLRDQSPKSAMHTAALMAHYPEMLSMCILLNSPWLFSATWSVISKVLDDRVRAKVLFLKGDNAMAKLVDRIGQEATDWIINETKDSREKRKLTNKQGHEPKRYWIPPESPEIHDPRGLPSYVNTEYYIKTPGDLYLERQNLLATN